MAEKKRCLYCMHPVPDGVSSCPTCGYDGTQKNPDGALPVGTRLNNKRFLVGRVEEVLADCVKYAGYDLTKLERCVVMEYLPAGAAVRSSGDLYLQATPDASKKYKDGLAKFIQFYANFEHAPENTALPRYIDSFIQNGTGYVVFAAFEGMTLRDLLKVNGGTLSAEQTQIVLEPVLKGLIWLQRKNVVHGSISPDNILINRNGDVCLAGFSTDPYAPSNGLNGYISPEAENGKKLSLSSDVYSIGAIFYRCMIGTVPQDAKQRTDYDTLATPKELNPSIPWDVSNAVWHAMLVDPEKRIETVAEFAKALRGEVTSFDNGPIEYKPNIVFPEDMEPSEEELLEEKAEREKAVWSMAAILSVSLFLVMIFVYIFSGLIQSAEQKRRMQEIQQALESQTGTVTVPAPDYLGTDIADVEYDTLQFDYVIVSTYDPSKRENLVVGQDPQPGTGLNEDDRVITLYVNRNKPQTVILPNFIGQYYMNARALAESLGLKVEIVYETTKETYPGLVFRQNAEEGLEFLTSNVLKLTVAQAPPPEETDKP